MGLAPDRLRFEDEEAEAEGATGDGSSGAEKTGLELRCKKCRRVLATEPFIVPHRVGEAAAARTPCPHFFVEPLSWMRPVLEEGELEGRLVCPNVKCAASIGRYAWQGFKCSCSEWVCPALSLQRSKVDDVVTRPAGSGRAGTDADRMAALGIRLPPGTTARQENL